MAIESSNVANSNDRGLIYGAQAVGCIAGVTGIAMGVYNCITFSASCFVAGILLGIFSFILVVIEAPYCCLMFDFTDKVYTFSQRFPPLLKAVAYIIVAILPVIMCVTSLSIWIACCLIASCGILYGVRALRRAREPAGANDGYEAGNEGNELSSGSKTNLVSSK